MAPKVDMTRLPVAFGGLAAPQAAAQAPWTPRTFRAPRIRLGLAVHALGRDPVTVGYNLGTSFADFVKLRLPNASVKEVESPARDWQDLLAGRVDVTISSILEAGKLSSTHETLVIPFQKVANSLPLSFIVPQDDHVWLNFMNNWMRIKHEVGYFKSLNETWGIQGQD